MSCPLTFASSNKQLKIVNILGNAKAKAKLQERGFFIGEHLSLKTNQHGNGFILETKQTKYAMGFGLANKIIVDEL